MRISDWSSDVCSSDLLLRQLSALARHQPLLMIYEDVHWIDPSSRELLERVVDRAASLPMLLVITFRPEFQPPWAGQSHVTTLALRARKSVVSGKNVSVRVDHGVRRFIKKKKQQ